MDVNGSARFRNRKIQSSDRLLAAFPHAPQQYPAASPEENELNEDDIFSTGDFSSESPNHHNQGSSVSSASSTPRHHQHASFNHKAFSQRDSFGILAALPEHRTNSHHLLYQKTTVSSSASSTASSSTTPSRFIPSIPKPPQERMPISSPFSRNHQHLSAPVNVPVMSVAMRMRNRQFDEVDEDEEERDGEMLPPHEIVARAQSPAVACSVLEGVGRTLKGRDLRQVRNAIWRRTGFLD